jgi:hypothetical protein
MSRDAKVERYEALGLGYLLILALTIRHTDSGQSLTLELLKGEQTVSLTFTGLRELRLADLRPGESCLLTIFIGRSRSMGGHSLSCVQHGARPHVGILLC